MTEKPSHHADVVDALEYQRVRPPSPRVRQHDKHVLIRVRCAVDRGGIRRHIQRERYRGLWGGKTGGATAKTGSTGTNYSAAANQKRRGRRKRK